MRAFSRYFLFQVVNVFLVTTIFDALFETLARIIATPEEAFKLLAGKIPGMASFFITFVLIKTFLGLGVELVRTMSLIQAILRYLCIPNPTLRMQRQNFIGMRSIDNPGWFPFHKILAQDMLLVVASVVFAVIAPLVLLPCAIFFLFSRILWTHHHLYVYESVFETGGQFWPKIFRRFVFGLIIAQMTITGQFILTQARHQAYATIFLIFLTYFFLRSTRARYDLSSSTLPLEVATVMDISLNQEEEAMRKSKEQRRAAAAAAASSAGTGLGMGSERNTTGVGGGAASSSVGAPPSTPTATTTAAFSVPDSTTTSEVEQDTFDQQLGSRIGSYDPFKHAYLQPALRANPRARPEQPFPPNQLGRTELPPQQDELTHSAGATVRLKSLNQQDRRFINRWWSDQLQRCGDPDILKVLSGQECGNLTLGNRDHITGVVGRTNYHPPSIVKQV